MSQKKKGLLHGKHSQVHFINLTWECILTLPECIIINIKRVEKIIFHLKLINTEKDGKLQDIFIFICKAIATNYLCICYS